MMDEFLRNPRFGRGAVRTANLPRHSRCALFSAAADGWHLQSAAGQWRLGHEHKDGLNASTPRSVDIDGANNCSAHSQG